MADVAGISPRYPGLDGFGASQRSTGVRAFRKGQPDPENPTRGARVGIEPGYGETPLDGEELDSLDPALGGSLGLHISKTEIYDLESALHEEVRDRLMGRVDQKVLGLDEMLRSDFVVGLHRTLFSGIWSWAGAFRRTAVNIGVDPHSIATDLHASLETLRYQWAETELFNPHSFGIAVHAELVRIHPFTDGNGRLTRLLADLVSAAAQPQPHTLEYDWNIDKVEYIRLLRLYDANRDPFPLADFVSSVRIR